MNKEIDWEVAYKNLEEQVEFMMKETEELITNTPPELKINKILVDRSNGYASLIVNASGSNMMYACYLYENKTKKELVKTQYQYSNSFVFKLPKGKYFARIFVKANRNNNQKVVDTITFNS
ncbi:hypothetical protein [Macrococcus animalis]|uniref:hypothetical protein n=1 Tax=Macrococcus animalis TaxID=3395467 RepID=UPI0039BE5D9D